MIPPLAFTSDALVTKKGYVYLLQSFKSGRFYLGWTTNLDRRLLNHNMGKSFYTKSRGTWKLIYYEEFMDKEKAKERERKLKNNPNMLNCFKKRAMIWQAKSLQRQVVG